MQDELESGPGLSKRAFFLSAAAMLVVLGAMFVSVRGLPMFSESQNHAWVARDANSWRACFDLARVPLRPLQHLYFHVITRWESPDLWLARLPAFLLHFGSALLVIRLARQWGANALGMLVAGWLFIAAPNIKNLIWVSAVNAPGRVFCLLAMLLLFRRFELKRNPVDAVAAFVAFVIALGFHQAAIVAPVFLMAAVFARQTGNLFARLGACLRGLRNPLTLAIVVATAAYVIYVTFLRDERHHGARSLDSLPANAVKGTLSIVPEELRLFAVEALRGNLGQVSFALGGALVGAMLLVAVWCILRGRPASRFVAIAIVTDLGLHALTAGFDQRYAYLSSALLAVGLGVAASTSQPARILSIVLLPWWAFDQFTDLAEYRSGGAVINTILETATAERARVGPGVPIVVVDLPEVWGAENDIAMLDWGFPQAMLSRGGGPWELVRLTAFYKYTSAELRSREQVRARLSAPGTKALVYDRIDGEFVDSLDQLNTD